MVETGSENAETLELEGQAAVAASEQAEQAQHDLYSKSSTKKPVQKTKNPESELNDQDKQDAQAVMTGEISLQEVV